MIRFYILPVEEAVVRGITRRGPKYIGNWRDDGQPYIACDWAMYDYGRLIDACLLCADVTQEQHEQLNSEIDVVGAPLDIDQNVSEVAIPKIQQVLEALRIPAAWVDTSYTYRQVLRMVAGLFQFAQRYYGMHDEQLIDNPSQLDLRWNQIPLAKRQRITATADDLGYDYSGFQPNWLVRRILWELSQQWGARMFEFGLGGVVVEL